MSNFWDDFEKASKEEEGGGGIIGRIKVKMGFKVFVSGMSNEDSFLEVTNVGEKEAAKVKAIALGKPQWCVALIAIKEDSVVGGQPATWEKGDRWWVEPVWQDSGKLVIKHLREAGVKEMPSEFWGRIGFAPDPFKEAQGDAGKTDTDKEGNARFPLVAYVSEVFKNKAEAQAAMGLTDTSSAEVVEEQNPNAPPGWKYDAWVASFVSIKEAAKTQSPPTIAEQWGIPVSFVISAINS